MEEPRLVTGRFKDRVSWFEAGRVQWTVWIASYGDFLGFVCVDRLTANTLPTLQRQFCTEKVKPAVLHQKFHRTLWCPGPFPKL